MSSCESGVIEARRKFTSSLFDESDVTPVNPFFATSFPSSPPGSHSICRRENIRARAQHVRNPARVPAPPDDPPRGWAAVRDELPTLAQHRFRDTSCSARARRHVLRKTFSVHQPSAPSALLPRRGPPVHREAARFVNQGLSGGLAVCEHALEAIRDAVVVVTAGLFHRPHCGTRAPASEQRCVTSCCPLTSSDVSFI